MPCVACFIQPRVVLLSKCTWIYTCASTMHFVIPRTIQRARRIHQNTSRGLTMEQRPQEMNSVVPRWGYKKGTYRGRKQQNNQKGGGINLWAAIREQPSHCAAGCAQLNSSLSVARKKKKKACKAINCCICVFVWKWVTGPADAACCLNGRCWESGAAPHNKQLWWRHKASYFIRNMKNCPCDHCKWD